MVVRSVNKNITCAANTTAWTTGATLTLSDVNDVILKQVKLWFSPGCRGQVHLRILLNDTLMLPDPLNSYSDDYVGSDVLYPIFLGLTLHQSYRLTVQYKNLDYSSHTIAVMYELQPLVMDNQPQIMATTPTTGLRTSDIPIPAALKEKVEISSAGKPVPVVRDFVYRAPKAGRVGDESERAYVGNSQENLPDWLKMDGYPAKTAEDPRKKGQNVSNSEVIE